MDNLGTRIEIRKQDGANYEWVALLLDNNKGLNYNKVINKIGKRDALDFKIFNQIDLAKALNKKYEAKYYVDEVFVAKGFLIINNTTKDSININFIDEPLSLSDKWKSTTYKQLLETSNTIPNNFLNSLNSSIRNYDLDITEIVTSIPNVVGENYPICTFPNSLSVVGDKFQKDDEGLRVENYFNPFQSRPIWNVRAFLEIITRNYGYTPIYDGSIDLQELETLNLVSKDVNKGTADGESFEKITNSSEELSLYHFRQTIGDGVTFVYGIVPIMPDGFSVTPNSLPWSQPPEPYFWSNDNVSNYGDIPCIYTPNLTQGFSGSIVFEFELIYYEGGNGIRMLGVWKNSAGTDVLFAEPLFTIEQTSIDFVKMTVSKNEIATQEPVGAGDFVGILIVRSFPFRQKDLFIKNMVVTEQYLPEGTISFDDFEQFNNATIDLTYSAPRENITKTLNGIMQQQGILLQINTKEKEVLFFTYGHYNDQVNDGVFYDWSEYVIYDEIPEWNTNYGKDYARLNRVSLDAPYKGNFFDVALTNFEEQSKYKDFIENKTKGLKDVENAISVQGSSLSYIEFEHKGGGLVEHTVGDRIGLYTQSRADGSTQGTANNVATVFNVNYGSLPNGVFEWYNVITSSVKCKDKFLLPTKVFRELDLSVPIYVEKLGGYYIIEEVSEYKNSREPVTVKLIKLTDNIKIQE